MATATANAPSHGQLWFRALRAPFLVASVVPAILAGVLALVTIADGRIPGASFRVELFLLCVAGAATVHLASNMLNDNFDYRSGDDLAVKHQNPFAGGGRVLPQRVLNLNAHLAVALGFLAVTVAIGLYLFTLVGYPLLWIGVIGVFAAVFYVAPPLRLAHLGIGELFVGLGFGPLVVLGTYYVLTLQFDWGPLFLSAAMGLLVAAILWINEFPDVEADLSVGKRTLMARLGYARSISVYFYLVALAYIAVFLAVLTAQVPVTALLVFLTLPGAAKAYRHLEAHYADPMALIPANAGTVMLTVQFGILAIVGVAAGLVL